MTAPTGFQERVYALCRRIPCGRVTSYGEMARALGGSSPRAVGQALRRNPYAPEVPCHRVVAADGKLGGFNGQRRGPELSRKIALLAHEGVSVDSSGRVPAFYFWRFDEHFPDSTTENRLAKVGLAAKNWTSTGD